MNQTEARVKGEIVRQVRDLKVKALAEVRRIQRSVAVTVPPEDEFELIRQAVLQFERRLLGIIAHEAQTLQPEQEEAGP